VFAGAIMHFLDFKSFEPSQKLRIINTTKNREQIHTCKGDGWLGYVGNAPVYYGSCMGSNPDNSQKYKMGDISKGLASPPKN
jgi:hypothetical protein